MRSCCALRTALRTPRAAALHTRTQHTRARAAPPRRPTAAAMGSSSDAAAPAPGDAPSPSPPPLAPPSTRDDGFRVVSETVSYKRYLTLYDRVVEYPPLPAAADEGAQPQVPPPRLQYAFDVVGHPRAQFTFVTVVPFHPGPEPAVTMIREYAQARPPADLSRHVTRAWRSPRVWLCTQRGS
jgi:hypothetical protein